MCDFVELFTDCLEAEGGLGRSCFRFFGFGCGSSRCFVKDEIGRGWIEVSIGARVLLAVDCRFVWISGIMEVPVGLSEDKMR